MPRFYFDFIQSGEHSIDEEGSEFPDAEGAYLDAFEAAREMWSELLAERRDPNLCHFEILSADRDLLFVLPLREVIDSCQDRRSPRRFGPLIANAIATAGAARRAEDGLKREIQSMRQTLEASRKLLIREL